MMPYDPLYDAEPDWDAIFADAATHYVPPNTCETHGDDDERILENARQQAQWMKRIMAAVTET